MIIQSKIEKNDMKYVFAPGCTLMLYKPELAEKIKEAIASELGEMDTHLLCCHHDPKLEANTCIISVCSACDKRFAELNKDLNTMFFWEVLAESKTFSFPNYNGTEMTIHDTCSTRTDSRYQDSTRKLLERMNIKVVEPELTRQKGICCGDRSYGKIPVEQVKVLMKKRADQMPREEVVVSCISCVKAMHIGGKKPRFIIDLLFEEETDIGVFDPDLWHAKMNEYIKAH